VDPFAALSTIATAHCKPRMKIYSVRNMYYIQYWIFSIFNIGSEYRNAVLKRGLQCAVVDEAVRVRN